MERRCFLLRRCAGTLRSSCALRILRRVSTDARRLLDAFCKQREEEERAANAVSREARAAALAKSGALRGVDQPHTWYLCFDVEATCMAGRGQFDYPNEIIVRS